MPTPQDLNEVLDLKWDLSDLYPSPDDPSFFQDLEKSRKRADEFQTVYKDLPISSLDPPDFLRALKEYESIQEEGAKPFLYASLLFAEDTQSNQYKSLMQRAKEQWNELENRLLFFRLALIELPEERLQSLLTHEPLKTYEHALQFLQNVQSIRRQCDLPRTEVSLHSMDNARVGWFHLLAHPLQGGGDPDTVVYFTELFIPGPPEFRDSSTVVRDKLFV